MDTDSDVEELVSRLSKLDACAVSDALDALGLPGAVSGLRPLTGDHRIAGRVQTVELGPPRDDIAPRHLCTGAVDAGTATDVIVVAHQARTDCAGWGGNLSRAALARGIRGTLVDGAARDIDEARQIGYPVFAGAATARTARGRTQEHAWDVPVQIGTGDETVTVAPGDYVIADASGAVFVPAGAAADVLTRAEQIAAKEAAMAAAIERGEPVSQVMGANYERMLVDEGAN